MISNTDECSTMLKIKTGPSTLLDNDPAGSTRISCGTRESDVGQALQHPLLRQLRHRRHLALHRHQRQREQKRSLGKKQARISG